MAWLSSPTLGFLRLYQANVHIDTHPSHNSTNIRCSPPANMEMIMVFIECLIILHHEGKGATFLLFPADCLLSQCS